MNGNVEQDCLSDGEYILWMYKGPERSTIKSPNVMIVVQVFIRGSSTEIPPVYRLDIRIRNPWSFQWQMKLPVDSSVIYFWARRRVSNTGFLVKRVFFVAIVFGTKRSKHDSKSKKKNSPKFLLFVGQSYRLEIESHPLFSRENVEMSLFTGERGNNLIPVYQLIAPHEFPQRLSNISPSRSLMSNWETTKTRQNTVHGIKAEIIIKTQWHDNDDDNDNGWIGLQNEKTWHCAMTLLWRTVLTNDPII